MPQEPYLIWRQLTREEAQWIDHMRQAKTCANKVRFGTYEAALRGAIKAHLDHRNAEARKPYYPYECKICACWHLTKRRPVSEPRDHDYTERS
jgi:hypothetical protein